MDDKPTETLPCAAKLSFDSQTAANGAALYAKHRYGTRLKVYQCEHCQLWHLASD